jgi:hypothetical protein
MKKLLSRRSVLAPAVAGGYQRIDYEVYIDQDRIDAMARKAAALVGQRAVDGPILVRIMKRERASHD